MKKKILDNIIYALGVMAAIFFLLFNSKLGVLIVGMDIFVIVISILLIINKNIIGVILAIISGTVGLALFLHHIKYFTSGESLSFVLDFSLFFTTVISTIKYLYDLNKNAKTHEMLVIGEVIDLVKNPNLAVDYYVPVLGYEIKGEEFQVNYNVGFSKNIPEIGDTYNLYINPNDYYDVYFKPPIGNVIKNIAVNVFLSIITLIILFNILH
jgi:hypothetical protein